MKRLWVLGALAAAGLSRPTYADISHTVPANTPAVLYEGRCVVDPDGSVRMGFPGVTLHLRFRGKTLVLRARANKDNFLDVSVDNGAAAQLRLHAGEGDYPLVDGPEVSEHTVVLIRCNESWQGTCTFLGFDTGADGALLEPVKLPPRRLMFIGDSVTCGEMAAWAPQADPKRGSDGNARLSYGMILARNLGAQCALVSYGGRGIIRDWQGNRDAGNAPQFYELALPDDPTVFWKHGLYVPDAIGIQLGTNDFSRGIPDQNEFVNAYVEFVRKVQRDAPGALIFLMDSPILQDDPVGGPRRSALHSYLAEIVKRVASEKVILAPLSHYAGVPGNGHPTGPEHREMAAELEPLLRRELGW
jgi:lysophospholipase L1-like esterase